MRLQSNFMAPPARPTSSPRFTGQVEKDVYKAKLNEFPVDSMNMVAKIQRARTREAPAHALHAGLAKRIGSIDKHIEWLNHQFTSLFDMKNPERFKPEINELATEHLEDLHQAIAEVLLENDHDITGFPFETPYLLYKARLNTFPASTIDKLANIKRFEISAGIKQPAQSPLAKSMERTDKHIHWLNQRFIELHTIMDPSTYTPESNKIGQAHLEALEKALLEKLQAQGYDAEGKKTS